MWLLAHFYPATDQKSRDELSYGNPVKHQVVLNENCFCSAGSPVHPKHIQLCLVLMPLVLHLLCPVSVKMNLLQ